MNGVSAAMALAYPLWNQKKKMVLFVGLILQDREGNFTTGIQSRTKGEEAHVNGSNRPGWMEMTGDVKSLCKQSRLKEALDILHVMDQRGIRPDSSTYASLLQVCLNMKALSEGKLVHAHIIQTGFNPDICLGNKLVSLYAKCRRLVDARRVFDEMPKRNVVSWTAIIAAYARHGYDKDALALFHEMQRTGVPPNQFTFAIVVPVCANLTALEDGKKIHEHIIRNEFQSDGFVERALVEMYAKCGSMENARQVFDKMSERDVVSWTTLIAGYAQSGHVDEALKLFQKMTNRDVVSWNSMITGCVKNGHFDEALKLFQKMPQRNVVSWTAMLALYTQNGFVDKALKLFQNMPERNVVSWTAMIAGYAQNGLVDDALQLFQNMPERNVVSWNVMIAGCEQTGYFNKALDLFEEMKQTGMKPDGVSFSTVLPACANLLALKHGKEVHENIIKSGFLFDIFVGSALVDMYSKCGNLEDAWKVFEKMPVRNVVSWNAMIEGYAMHGRGKETLQLFEQMQHSCTKPNHVTFIGVLSACCHAGLVDDGWKYFDCMRQDYQITPTVEHYCCIVDLLGRAGRLDEAESFINQMPIKPNAAVWGSLLGASRIHTNIELGERVAENIFGLEPRNATCYVLLSNIYAMAGRWDDVEKVRKLMKDRGIKKSPGYSWIELDNKVYSFLVGDRSHPQINEIYAELERLSGQMKEAGYVPNTNLALHDVEEEQKEHILCHHSEKLAIAFGLIHTSAGTPLRLAKNLRACADCHSATKFISKIVKREIVVRDSNRFHHFMDGQCSCGDYW